ncbi:MAG: AAA family ATPase [Saprospiraceae bacterium]
MRRKDLKNLVEWKAKNSRKPLIINGARQVGKTWLINEFGKKHFLNLAYINFETTKSLSEVFNSGYQIDKIIKAIEIEVKAKIDPATTLIIFDEVQQEPKALTALKYFYEQAPQYHIICAGSLLGISMQNGGSFPVGKVEFLDLYPLNFYEYLDALNETALRASLELHEWDIIRGFHSRLKDLLRQYFYLGGMPEVLKIFINNRDFNQAREIQNQILRSYELDFSKHAPGSIIPRIRMMWNSIPSQLAKENKKFIYNAIKPGARSKDYELALEWLLDAGLVYKVNNISTAKVPLKNYENLDAFKLYVVDVGLLGAMVNIQPAAKLDNYSLLQEFKGSLTEQFVLQELKASKKAIPYYWSPSNAKAEVDFLFENRSNIFPLEVKAAENLQSKSLRVFNENYKPEMCFRTSMSNYRKEDWLTNIPLYSIQEIFNL